MAVNDQYKAGFEFFPGIRSGADAFRPPGTTGASGSAADDTGAGPVTLPSGAWQPAARYLASTGGTTQPGQSETTAISPGPQPGYVDTNSGRGRVMTNELDRYPWQQGAS